MTDDRDPLFQLGMEQRLAALEKRRQWPDAFASMVHDVTALAKAEHVWMTLGLVGVVSVVVFNIRACSVENTKVEQQACAKVEEIKAQAEHYAVSCSNACGRRQENYDNAVYQHPSGNSGAGRKWHCYCRPNNGAKSVSIW